MNPDPQFDVILSRRSVVHSTTGICSTSIRNWASPGVSVPSRGAALFSPRPRSRIPVVSPLGPRIAARFTNTQIREPFLCNLSIVSGW
jgi:hypothetical protein